LTKHLPDDTISKLHLSFDETNKLIESTLQTPINPMLCISNTHLNPKVTSIQKVPEEHALAKTRTRSRFIKNRLARIMHKLYELEKENTPAKTMNVDLTVDLYQMENY
jgi:hypothetical protein